MSEKTHYQHCTIDEMLEDKYLGKPIQVRGIARGVVSQPSQDIPDYLGDGPSTKQLNAIDFYALLQQGEQFVELWGRELLPILPAILKASSESNIEVLVKGDYINETAFRAIDVHQVELNNIGH
jgi:hypothetical protein